MAPCAEAGSRSYLFAGDVDINTQTDPPTVLVDKQAVALDLEAMNQGVLMTLQSDRKGRVNLNKKPTTEKVTLFKNSVFRHRTAA